jgi:pimeloyl-ACP methyl ester carboxylesterase
VADRATSTVVLVHGGWHGGWCWRDVVPLLRAAGDQVLVPTLTGLGDRAHLLDRKVDLELHVRDLLEVLHHEDVRDAVLVAHSYGGMVAAGVADRAPERVAHVVYLDAFVPAGGLSLFDILLPERREIYAESAREDGDGWLVPSPPPQAFGVTDAEAVRWAQERLRPQPLRTFEQPLPLTSPPGTGVPCSFIHCTEGPAAPNFARFARHAAELGWRTRELPTGHDAMITMPRELAALLQ